MPGYLAQKCEALPQPASRSFPPCPAPAHHSGRPGFRYRAGKGPITLAWGRRWRAMLGAVRCSQAGLMDGVGLPDSRT